MVYYWDFYRQQCRLHGQRRGRYLRPTVGGVFVWMLCCRYVQHWHCSHCHCHCGFVQFGFRFTCHVRTPYWMDKGNWRKCLQKTFQDSVPMVWQCALKAFHWTLLVLTCMCALSQGYDVQSSLHVEVPTIPAISLFSGCGGLELAANEWSPQKVDSFFPL